MNHGHVGEAAPTNLIAKILTNAFERASYVTLCVTLSGLVDREVLEKTLVEMVRRAPLLRTKLEFSRLGVPLRFRFYDARTWFTQGGFRVGACISLERLPELEEDTLNEPFDAEHEFLFQCILLNASPDSDSTRSRSVLLCKLHHTIVDSLTARSVIPQFIRLYEGYARSQSFPKAPHVSPSHRAQRGTKEKIRDLREWWRSADKNPVQDPPSLISNARLSGPLSIHRMRVSEVALPIDDLAEMTAKARSLGVTFAQGSCACILRAQNRYNRAYAHASAPSAIGMRIAFKRDRSRALFSDERQLGPSIDSRLITASRDILEAEGYRALSSAVKAAIDARDATHFDPWNVLFYSARRMLALASPPPKDWYANNNILLAYSDGISPHIRLGAETALTSDLRINDVHPIASTISPHHVTLISSTYNSKVRFTATYFDGVIDGPKLLDLIREELLAFLKSS